MKTIVCLIVFLISIPGMSYSAEMVYSLAVDKTIDGGVYTSTCGGGMWKADKDLIAFSGRSSGLSNPLPIEFHTILCAAIAPSNSAIMYCGNTDGHVYRSSDRGNTWLDTWLNLRKVIRNLAVDPLDADHVYAAGERGLYEQKAGTNWQMVLPGEYRIFEDVAFDPFEGKIIYTITQNYAGNGSLLTSRDSGGTWTETKFAYGVCRISLDPTHEGTLYLASRGGVFKTVDDGVNWEFLVTGLPDALVTAIAIDPMDVQIVYAGTMDGLYISENSGSSWVNTNLVEGMVTNLAFSSGEDSLFIATARYGILKQALTE